eukprot:TRINITY_DN3340_c0_g2_i1.p4 TRINITY_DN3340_c0_g2~~TRINITY_DN3340_c0_g2_i1.p4  ORF type:complete len:158 (+),score=21.43 TRINITY_DN3340_c0_g2_i1:467-940(+)
MQFHKLNILHLKLVGSSSTPLNIPSAPEITKNSIFSLGEQFSVDDIEGIVNYARIRGIRVIPEIEAPNQCASYTNATKYNKFRTNCSSLNKTWCLHKNKNLFEEPSYYQSLPCQALNPTLNETYSELLAPIFNTIEYIFKEEDYFHLGNFFDISIEC